MRGNSRTGSAHRQRSANSSFSTRCVCLRVHPPTRVHQTAGAPAPTPTVSYHIFHCRVNLCTAVCDPLSTERGDGNQGTIFRIGASYRYGAPLTPQGSRLLTYLAPHLCSQGELGIGPYVALAFSTLLSDHRFRRSAGHHSPPDGTGAWELGLDRLL